MSTAPRPASKGRMALALHALGTTYLPDVIGVAWIVLFAALYLSPALKDGAGFGPADLGRGLSLLTHVVPQPALHNSINGDTITQGVPWNTLDWRLVHAGQFPLWNSLSGTGLPQMFNFESAPLSLPTLVGYLVPLSMSFLVTVAVKLVIAGTGVYVCCRLLGTKAIAAAFGGTTFMLSGAFAGWLGWSVGGPVAWGGWILAGTIVCYRSRGRVRDIVLLAISVAFCLYAGFPESYVLLAMGLGAVLVVGGIVTLAFERRIGVIGVVRVGAGTVLGGMLAAPLLLPGVSLLSGSARNGKDAATGIPMHLATLIFAQGFFGLPTKGSFFFGQVNYYETAAYVGIVAIICAGVSVLVSWRRPVVIGLLLAAVGCFFTIYQLGSGAPVQRFLSKLGLSAVALQRIQSVFELVVAVLAGLGLEILLRRWREQVVRIAFTATTVVMALVLAELWRKVATARLLPTQLPSSTTPSVATLESLRRSSLIWPTATIVAVVLLVVASWVFRRSSPERPWARRASSLAALVLLGAQSAFLLFAGVGINSYSHDANPVTPQVATLTSIVGSKLVGLDGGNTNCAASSPHNQIFCGVRLWRGVGFYPEMNISYGVDELGLHDPTIPQAYFDAWPVPNAEQVTPVNLNLFAPDVDTVALARRYGVAYVLAAPGEPAPKGMQLEAMISGEALYFVPGSERFSFVGADSAGSGPGRVSAHVVSSSHPSDAKYVVDVSAPRMSKLAVRITDVTGWHAVTNTGKTLTLHRYEGGLLSVEVPAGTRTVTLTYWPRRFTEGIIVAVLALAILVGWAVAYPVGSRWRRKRAPKVVAGLPES